MKRTKWVMKMARVLVVAAVVAGSVGFGGNDRFKEAIVPVAQAATPVKAGAASPSKPVVKPSDYSKHWAKEWIDWSVTNKLLWKYTDGTFRPDETVTQAQFLAALVKVQGLKEKTPHPPTAKHWAKDVYEMVAKAGWLTPDIKLNPDGKITRYEAAAWITNAWGHKTYDPLMFTYERNLMEASYKFQRGLYKQDGKNASSDYNYYFKTALKEDKFTRAEAAHTFKLISGHRNDIVQALKWLGELQKSLYLKGNNIYGKVPNIPIDSKKNRIGISYHPINVKADGSNIMPLKSGQSFSIPSKGKLILQGGNSGYPTILFVWELPNLTPIDKQNDSYRSSEFWNNRNQQK